MDILQGNGAALRTGDRLLCDEYNVTILHKRSSVFFHNINNIILVGDDVRFDAQAAVLDAVNLDGFILFRIDDIPFGAFRLLRSASGFAAAVSAVGAAGVSFTACTSFVSFGMFYNPYLYKLRR